MEYIILEILVDESRPDLIELYKSQAKKHNSELQGNSYPNAGFDLIIPDDVEFSTPFQTQMVDLKIRAQMWDTVSDLAEGVKNADETGLSTAEYFPTGYYLYPRSSLSKTQLMLANHVGIIDSGYRNNILCAFRLLPLATGSESPYKVPAGTRLVQICHPSLSPIFVNILTNSSQLTSTTRTGGFGSTGGTI